MPFPKTLAELKAAGYVFSSRSNCKSCKASIEWWSTPRGSRICMDPMLNDTAAAVSHFATCPDASSFRRHK